MCGYNPGTYLKTRYCILVLRLAQMAIKRERDKRELFCRCRLWSLRCFCVVQMKRNSSFNTRPRSTGCASVVLTFTGFTELGSDCKSGEPIGRMSRSSCAFLVVGAAVVAGAFTGGGLSVVVRSPAAPLRRAAVSPTMEFIPGETCTGERVAVVGATGYIGKAVVRDLVRRGYPTSAVVRDAARGAAEPKFEGATIVEADVCDPSSLAKSAAFSKGGVDVVVSCLASRSGSKSDSFAIDYQATLNSLNAARAAGARHFVLLSAYCVKSAERRDPYALQFQYAKMKMEEALRAQSDMTYSIVRPTAFFKSVSGQVEVVSGGAPFVYFDLGGSSYKSSHGDGKCATCNPISEPDLAAALVDTIADPSKCNALWNLGGPDVGLSMREQGELVADVLGKEEAKLLGVPIGIFDVIINGLQASAL